jgi:hypothetical protein
MTEYLVVTSFGNIGIGTTTPIAKLAVQGDSGASILDLASSTGTSVLRVSEAGNVGIGTSTPSGAMLVIDISNSSSDYGVSMFANNGNYLKMGPDSQNSYIEYGSGDIAFFNGSGTSLALTSNNKVAIGTSTPTNKLTIADPTSPQLTLSHGAGLAQWAFRNAGGNFYMATTTVAGTATTTTTALTILGSNGYVGIGTTSPTEALQVKGDIVFGIGGGGYLGDFQGTLAGTNAYFGANVKNVGGTPTQIVTDFATWLTRAGANADDYAIYRIAPGGAWDGNSPAFKINSAGNVGIGEYTPGSRLSVSGGATIGTAYDTLGAPTNGLLVEGASGFGTTTPTYTHQLTISSSTAPQLSLSAGAGIAQWVQRNAGGNLYFATTTVAGTATTSISALEISGSGFGTTTVRGLNISGQATTTSNVGINLSGGCYAMNGSCLTNSSSTLFGDFNVFTGDNFFNGKTGFGTTTPFYGLTVASSTGAQIALSHGAGIPQWTMRNAGGNFYMSTTTVAGTSTTSLSALTVLGSNGYVGIATSSPIAQLTVAVTGSYPTAIYTQGGTAATGINALTIQNNSTQSWNLGVYGSSQGTTYGTNGFFIYDNVASSIRMLIDTSGNHHYTSSQVLKFHGFTDVTANNVDVGIARNNAGVLEVNSGTQGTLRDLAVRTINPGATALGISGATTVSSTLSVTGQTTLAQASSTRFSANQAWFGGTATTTITDAGYLGVGTSTPQYLLTVSSSTAPQLALSAGAGVAQWVQRNAGGNLYFATTTVAGTATTSISALEISGTGFGTTTVRGLNISAQATTTSNVGINLSGGCFAINGSCVSGGGSGASSTLLADSNTFSGTNNFTQKLGLATTTPFARLSVESQAGEAAFVVGSSTATSLIVDSQGNVGIGTTAPGGPLQIGTVAKISSAGTLFFSDLSGNNILNSTNLSFSSGATIGAAGDCVDFHYRQAATAAGMGVAAALDVERWLEAENGKI